MTHDGRTPYRYYVLVDWARPDPRDPYSVFRSPAEGGPPYELFDPKTGEWPEQVSLVDYFMGQDSGAVEVSAAEARRIADGKEAAKDRLIWKPGDIKVTPPPKKG